MHDIDQNLPDLMRRATAELEPDSADLVRRGMQKGLRLRRRRTAGLSIAAASMLVLTGAVAVAAQSLGAEDDAPFAGTPGLSMREQASKPVTSKDTLATLRQVLPRDLKVVDQEHWGSHGFTGASLAVDDGKGFSSVSISVQGGSTVKKCPTDNSRPCRVLPDGSILLTEAMAPVYRPGHPSDLGVSSNGVELHRPDGVQISLLNWNARVEKGSPKTRELPVFSVAQLTTMARSPLWKAPAAAGPKPTGTPSIQPGKIKSTTGG